MSNTGTALARLGHAVAAFSLVGNDAWAEELLRHFQREGIDTQGLLRQAESATGATAVLIDTDGERSFAHHPGAPASLTANHIRSHFALFARSRIVLFGYYPCTSSFGTRSRDLLQELQRAGCFNRTRNCRIGRRASNRSRIGFSYLDYYVPSLAEATNQTGDSDPERILKTYRSLGAVGTIGVKLGSRGALLSSKDGKLIEVRCITPPEPISDTTGAGDAFYAGLLSGVLRGMEIKQAAQLALLLRPVASRALEQPRDYALE